MEIQRDRVQGKVSLTKIYYWKRVLQVFGVGDSKLFTIPFPPHFKLSGSMSPPTDEDHAYMAKVHNVKVVATRPYLSYVVSIMSIYMHNMGQAISMMKVFWRYIQSTIDVS